MKRRVAIAASVAVWVVIIIYLSWSARIGGEKRSGVIAGGLSIHITDSTEVDIIRAPMVEAWVRQAKLWPEGKQIDSIDTRAITEAISAKDFVRDADTYVDLTGNVRVDVSQRVPAMRFINSSGHDFYFTADGYVVPVSGRSAHYVPVITGNFALPFDRGFSGRLEDYIEENEKKLDKNYIFLSKLINFVVYIGDDDFWSSQIVQINVTAPPTRSSRLTYEPEIELIPRVGDHVVMLGALDDYQAKLDKLLTFYRDAMSLEGWGNWKYVNLKYEGQVVCR
jgi:cell division protein FtsQ